MQAAPALLTGAIAAKAVLAATCLPTGVAVTAVAMANSFVMTTMQKAAVGLAMAAAIGGGLYGTYQSANLRSELDRVNLETKPMLTLNTKLQADLEEAERAQSELRAENERLQRERAELPKLRGDLATLRAQAKELTPAGVDQDDTAKISMRQWIGRLNALKQHFDVRAEAKIPEMSLLNEEDWLGASRGKLESELDFRRAMSSLRGAAENKVAGMMQPALQKYLEANNHVFPTNVAQLQGFFETPLTGEILERYAIVPSKELPSLGMGGDWIITQKAPVDDEIDGQVGIGPNGWGSAGRRRPSPLDEVERAFRAANAGTAPKDPRDLLPYATRPEQKIELDEAIRKLGK